VANDIKVMGFIPIESAEMLLTDDSLHR
jgi:hypothetical protein